MMIKKIVVWALCILLINQSAYAYGFFSNKITERERAIGAIRRAIDCLKDFDRKYANEITRGIIPKNIPLPESIRIALHICLFPCQAQGENVIDIHDLRAYLRSHFFAGVNDYWKYELTLKLYIDRYDYLVKMGRALAEEVRISEILPSDDSCNPLRCKVLDLYANVARQAKDPVIQKVAYRRIATLEKLRDAEDVK